jgi:lipopolysaccharide export system permease protein
VNLLHRYIFKQLVIATAMAVALFVFVLVMGNVMREVIDLLASGRLSLGMFAYLLALLIPGVLPYALPMGLLTAVLLVIGRVCAQQEYTAMRAAGLSAWTLAAPALLLSCLGVCLLIFINFFYAPAADQAYRVALASLARHSPLEFFRPGYYVRDFPGFVVYAGGREGDELRDVWIWVLDDKGRVTTFARGRRALLDYDLATDNLVLTLRDGTAMRYNGADPENMQVSDLPPLTFAEDLKFSLALSQLLGPTDAATVHPKLSLLTLPQLLDVRDHPPEPNPTAAEKAYWRNSVQMQIQFHFVGAFSVLALTLVGLPLALRVGRAENFVNLGLALVLAISYYFLLFMINLLHGHPELRPDLLLWLPNFALEGLGAWLLVRAARR